MSRCVVYQSGGFTNYGISYRKYSQEELAEMGNRAVTENDAIYCLKADSELHSELCEECTLHGLVGCDHCQTDAIDVAIKALEEVQQYRQIGTVSTCRNAVEICRAMIERGIEMDNIKEYITFEDNLMQRGYDLKRLIEMMEQQTAKKAITYRGTNRADCPACGATVRGIDAPFGNWCSKCGQRLDWEDEE